MNDLLDAIAALDSPALYAMVLLLAFAETAILADLIVPGEVGLFVAAAAGQRAGLSPVLLWLAAAVGATLGDATSFGIGRWIGGSALEHRPWIRRHVTPRLDPALTLVDRHGGAAVFLGRWIGALRALVPFVAGMSGMRTGRFLCWNVVASLAWGGVVVAAGYQAGPAAAVWFDRGGIALVAAVGVGLGVWALRHRRRAWVAPDDAVNEPVLPPAGGGTRAGA